MDFGRPATADGSGRPLGIALASPARIASPQVMSVSDKPWLADRQPSSRGGVLQVTTRRPRPGAASAGTRRLGPIEAEVAEVQAQQTHAITAIAPRGGLTGSFSRRHIDLQRVAGSLCTGRCTG